MRIQKSLQIVRKYRRSLVPQYIFRTGPRGAGSTIFHHGTELQVSGTTELFLIFHSYIYDYS